MAITLKDIYATHYKPTQDKPVSFKEFKRIWVEFIDLSVEELLLEGKPLAMTAGMSDLRVVRRKRNPKYRRVDFNETRKLREEDPTFKGVVYWIDQDWWCRYLWKKSRCRIKNKSKWSFRPTRGDKGLKKRLSSYLQSHELAYLTFRENGNI